MSSWSLLPLLSAPAIEAMRETRYGPIFKSSDANSADFSNAFHLHGFSILTRLISNDAFTFDRGLMAMVRFCGPRL